MKAEFGEHFTPQRPAPRVLAGPALDRPRSALDNPVEVDRFDPADAYNRANALLRAMPK